MTEAPARKARRLYIHGRPWWYKVGRTYAVIWNPVGRKHAVELDALRGLTHDLIDRGRWKKTTDGMIRPSHVERYIASHIDSLGGA